MYVCMLLDVCMYVCFFTLNRPFHTEWTSSTPYTKQNIPIPHPREKLAPWSQKVQRRAKESYPDLSQSYTQKTAKNRRTPPVRAQGSTQIYTILLYISA